jgi:hypothetical protein
VRGRAVAALLEFKAEILAFMKPFIHLDICMGNETLFRV